MAHSQIVSYILHHKGDNSYLLQRGGFSVGVRLMYMTDADGEDVIPVPLAMAKAKTIQAELMNEKRAKGSKYD